MTGSDNKTVRIWSLGKGSLEKTIRVPAGPGEIGKVDAVAMSPDAAIVAVAGRTRWVGTDPQEQIYMFDRATGKLTKRVQHPLSATQFGHTAPRERDFG